MSLPNAFVTLLTTPSYLPGALVLLHSILELHPEPRQFKTVCLVTPETVDARTIGEVRKAGFDLVIGVEPIGSGVQGEEGLKLMGRPDLNLALTKLHLFRLYTLFSTLIYLDADVLPLRPLSHLFTTTAPHVLSASPDTGWPDCFNSGVMVIRPNNKDWEGLRQALKNGEGENGIYVEGQEGSGALYGNGSFDGADQGLLNEYFSEEGPGGQWNRLSFLYNVTPTAAYQYEPAYRRYGSKVNAVHFIGPNKPWSSLSTRPAGMSLPQGKESKFDYPSLIDRWYEVYDRNVRPATAHHPDLAKRFKVPEHVAVWNSAHTIPHQPADRLDLDQLKAAVGIGMTAMTPGQYTSLPLDGRVDLIMPKPQAKQPSPPKSPTIVDDESYRVYTAPLPQTLHQQTTQPAIWDAQRSSPPVGGQPEMSIPMNTVYNAAWDEPAHQQATFYSSPEKRKVEPQYPNIPDSVKRDTWYSHFTGTTPDRSSIQPVFPWEQPGQRVPDRIFPQDSPRVSYKTNGKGAESIPLSKSNTVPEPSPASAPTPRSMSEAMASYTNAWDTLPQIQRYVDRVTGRPPRLGLGELPRGMDLSSLKSVPTTPRYESVPLRSRTRSGDRRSEASGDGDDEDDGESQESNNDSPAFVNSSRLERVQHPYPSNARYRDRQAQTDKKPVADAVVQKNPGESSSPALRTVPLSREASSTPRGGSKRNGQQQSSSSETTPRAPNVVTPQSTSEHSTPTGGTSSRLPFPVVPGATRRLSNNSNGSGSGSASVSRRISGMTDSGVPVAGQRPTRQFLASTDPDRMKKDTQETLSRFMQQGGGVA